MRPRAWRGWSQRKTARTPSTRDSGGRHGDDRDRTDLGGQKRQTGGPPGHTAPRKEEVARIMLATRERNADGDEDDQRKEQNRVVGPGQRRSGRRHSRIIRDLHAAGRLLQRGRVYGA